MTTGIVMFAHDSEQVSYTRLASWNAARIRQFTNLPICLITSTPGITGFDHVINVTRPASQSRYFADFNSRVEWTNSGRWQAYALTPFDRTVVIDADYVVNSNQLSILAELNYDFVSVKHNYDVTGLHDFVAHSQIGRARLPAYWATVFAFRSSALADRVFYSWQMVAENWQHYIDLYRINSNLYRNDTALSIALHIAYGFDHRSVPFIPWAVATVLPEHNIRLDNDVWQIEFNDTANRSRRVNITGQDLHVMGKNNLQKLLDGI